MSVEYPLTECVSHPHKPLEPGYGVCPHLLLDPTTEIVYFHRASKDSIGMIGCELCTPQKTPHAEGYHLFCAHCVREKGWVARP